MLDSLVAFADIGDSIEIEPATEFEFRIEGPYAGGFGPKDRDHSPDSSNLVVQAVWALAQGRAENSERPDQVDEEPADCLGPWRRIVGRGGGDLGIAGVVENSKADALFTRLDGAAWR
jgi:hypothetical protein